MYFTSNNELFKLSYKSVASLKGDDFEYVYRGNFSHELTKKILSLADTNIQQSKDTSAQRKLYFIMVEGLQNIEKHQKVVEEIEDLYPGMFAFKKQAGNYFITTGNLIYKDKISPLVNKLEQINSLDQNELKLLHKEALVQGEISNKGGAGLGLIAMARKSKNRLLYDFNDIDEQYSYFYLQIEVPGNKSVANHNDKAQRTSLSDIILTHKTLNSQNILLYFNGFLSQDNLLNMLPVIKNRLSSSKTGIKVSNVMVEMIQNIVKHGSPFESVVAGNPGIFIISQNKSHIILTSGNYVKNSDLEILKKRLNFINSLDDDSLSEYYDTILLDSAMLDSKRTGLGFSDIRMKCDGPLFYEFHKVNDTDTYYILQTAVKIKI